MSVDRAAAQLGLIIMMHRVRRGLMVERVARRCGVSAELFTSWEAGQAAPSSTQWARLMGALSRRLHAHTDLWRRAAAELAEDAARRDDMTEATAAEAGVTTSATELTTTPNQEQTEEEIVDKNDADKRGDQSKMNQRGLRVSRALRGLPKGWRARAAVNARIARAREILRAEPALLSRDLVRRLRDEFGVGLGTPLVSKVMRQEQRRERTAVIGGVVIDAKAARQSRRMGEQLRAAGAMIIDAVPNLVKYTLVVDADGCVSVDYELRVVSTSGGKITIKR